jgi:hypothetical protein
MYVKNIIGQKAMMKCGMEAEVIEDNGFENITVRFSDGCVVPRKTRHHFYHRTINNPNLISKKTIVGQEKVMKNGMRARVIEDNGAFDVKIIFEDGYIANCTRSTFKKGLVKNQNIIKGSLLGQKAIMNCGLEAEVIEDNGSNDITVRFSDGYTKKTRRQSFKNEEIDNSNYKRHSICGQVLMMKCGMEAEVVEDNGANDITVRFKDGYTTYHRERHAFIRRMISNPNCKKIEFVGRRQVMSCGMEAEVIEDFGFKNITIKFADGTILTKQRRDTFLLGHIKNPNFDCYSIKGRKAMMNCGMEAEVIDDFGDEDITVKFIDGTIKEHCARHNFFKGKIGNPNLANNYSLPQTLVYHFIHKFFPDTINNYRPDWLRNRNTLSNLEIDVWIPSKRIGIEYDGYYAHNEETQNSLEKFMLISSALEIDKLITILERGSVVHTSSKHINYQLDYVSEYNEYKFLLEQLEKTINQILNYLGVEDTIEINNNVIRELYYNIDPIEYRKIIIDNNSGIGQRIKSTVGQKAMMNCGMEAEVIEDNGSNSITIKFADGYISHKRTRQEFRRGMINNPNIIRGSLIGQEKIMKNGMCARVIEDNGAFDVKIQFEDGYIARCVRSTFKSGRVKNPNIIKGSLLGQKYIMNCGLEAKVIEDNGSNDITVRFSDGYTKKTRRQSFKNGEIDNPNRHSLIGKRIMMNCGMEAEVIEDFDSENITVRFTDGTIVAKRTRYSFLSKSIDNPNYNKYSLVGNKAMMNCGMEAEVVEDNGYNDITVKFSNGLIKRHCPRHAFKTKKLTPIVRNKRK